VLLEVEETLEALNGKYKLVVATKGDLLDQRRKLHNSGLESISTILK
jgi:putative hydrolase of the HAD superfamily